MVPVASKAIAAPAAAEGFRPRKRLWAALGLFVAGGISLNAIAEWRDTHGLLINASESLPNWAFVIHKTSVPKRGEYVFFVPPAVPLVIKHFGAKKQMFGKIVYGMPGDTVVHRGADVFVAGKLVSHMKPVTKLGEPLVAGPTGVIPHGCYYVGSPHKDGFDSRYAAIGYACSNKIVGVGQPIL
ncbi:S26 family signal peptidase [Sphingomonas sp. PP-F2F-A104-K0414]|uniref:S26 family signal peptidase n=1 Tax=Sphingomonas sp. PP-F2F-A104-K0414 TaxID=2135661 RepID=UPI00104A4DAD|nr:S26 family signal peptidase [Sphingomonas sp. PP-F2F-A104-K0414]